jgi:chromosome segregation ATPase
MSEERLERIEHRLDGMEHRLDNMEHRLDTLESDVGTLKSDVAILKSDVAILKQNSNAVREDVNDIRIKLTSLEGTIVTAIREGFGYAQANIQDVSYGLAENERRTRLLNQRVARIERQVNDDE